MNQYAPDEAINAPMPPVRMSPFYGKPMHDRDRFEQWFEDSRIPELERMRSSLNIAEFCVKFWKRAEVTSNERF